MPRKPKVKTVKKEVAGYKITVKCLGRFFNSEGLTLDEAINNLKIPNGKGISVWCVEHDGKKKERIIKSAITWRLFNMQGLAREIALKSFKLQFE